MLQQPSSLHFGTESHMRAAKIQTRLRKCAVSSESSLLLQCWGADEGPGRNPGIYSRPRCMCIFKD